MPSISISSSHRSSDVRSRSLPIRTEQKCIALILILGLIQAFNVRFVLSPDSISYLDVGGYWLKGDIANAVNGYWNPLYPILLAVASAVVRNPFYEPFAAHMVNFAVLAFNLFLFSRLLRHVREYRSATSEATDEQSESLFTLVSYLLFLWCHLGIGNLDNLTPDFLVTSSVLASALFLMRMLRYQDSLSGVGLGVALGLGYLAKAIMFVAAPLFICAALFCNARVSRGFKNAAIATLCFGLISAPYVFSLSRQQGHVTYSEAGRLAYAWMVNKSSTWFHWQGTEPGSGTPVHPTRQLLKNPKVFEFGDRPGTYPPWFDPSYWNKGLEPHFKASDQLKAINQNLQLYHSVIFGEPISIALLILFGIGVYSATTRENRYRFKIWPLLIPALGGLLIYLPVYALPRHIAPFIFLLYFALLIITWPTLDRILPRRAIIVIAACGLIPTLFTITGQTIKNNFFKRNELTEQQRVAKYLVDFGFHPGDRIAVLGRACDANFARLARLKIVAEAYREADEVPLWAQVQELETRTVDALRGVKAKAIVRDTPPTFQSALDWKSIPGTRFGVLLLEAKGN